MEICAPETGPEVKIDRWLAASSVAGGRTILHCLGDGGDYPELALTSGEGLRGLVRRVVGLGLHVDRQDGEGSTALMCAALHGRTDVLVALVDEGGADPLARSASGGHTAAHAAVAAGRLGALSYLLDADARLCQQADDEEMTPLHHCAAATSLNRRWSSSFLLRRFTGAAPLDPALMCLMADRLLCRHPRPADLVRAPNMRGRTALMDAECPGLIALLLRWGADVKSHDDSGATAAHWAAYRGRADILRLLVGAGADVGATDVRGLTALHEACLYGQSEAARYLIREAGADIHLRTAHAGLTPLHYAMGNGRAQQIVVDLLLAGASPRATDASGHTPMDVGTDSMVLLAMDWVPMREEVLGMADSIGEATGLCPDLAALVVAHRVAGAAVLEMPSHHEMVEHVWHGIRLRRSLLRPQQRRVAVRRRCRK